MYKPQVFEWLKDVARRAEEQGKALVIFSPYPVTEYLNKSANDFYYMFSDVSYNNPPDPTPDTADKAIEAGIKLQFGGHIHVNDTMVHRNRKGPWLTFRHHPLQPIHRLISLSVVTARTFLRSKPGLLKK